MRPIVTHADFALVHAYLKDNYQHVFFCEADCGCAMPYLGSKFEVLEPLEYPMSANKSSVLPIGRYWIVEQAGGGTSHQIQLVCLDIDEIWWINWGYAGESMLDWRGTREIR